ncbi:MAG TPA: hypothetical protein VJR46_10990 [Candidatus Dormibacteraeota bacterium]|nr:hypothetical protein [Candidatus Dormibacteraeota bacterium]
MEFAVLCVFGLVLGFRGFRAGRRAYLWSAAATAVAALYTYHSH